MDERDFELLKTLGKTKNITRAADLLYATQSSLSKRISVNTFHTSSSIRTCGRLSGEGK